MIKIKPFSGDYEKVYDLIKKSWQEDYINKYRQPVQDFTPDFLKWNIEREGYDPNLILEGYMGDDLIGFCANLPRKLVFDGTIINAVLTTFITVDPDVQKKGVGKNFLEEQIQRIKENRIDLNYGILDEGHVSEKMFEKLAKLIKLPLLTCHRFTFLFKPLNSDKVKKIDPLTLLERIILPFISCSKNRLNKQELPPPPPTYSSREIDEIFDIMSKNASRNTVRSYFSKSDLPVQLSSQISSSIFHKKDGKTALINFYHIDLISCVVPGFKAKITMIDFVDFRHFSFFEKYRFIKKFCDNQAEQGSALILLPTMPLFDLKPFYANFFVPSGRYHNIRAIDFNNCLPDDVAVENIIFR